MTSTTKYISTSIAIIILIIIGYNAFFKKSAESPEVMIPITSSTTPPVVTTPPATGTQVKPPVTVNDPTKDFRSYANGEYSFTIKYPAYVQQRNSFSTFHEIGSNWRLNAAQANQGKNIVSFAIFNVDQGNVANGKQTYPLFFTSEVRVGVSPNTAQCYTPDTGFANQKVTNVVINGVTFKKFSASDAATMKYVQSESYRTIHNNLCYAIEQIKNGSNYRDETMTVKTTDQQLTNYYNVGETIVKTFKFTK